MNDETSEFRRLTEHHHIRGAVVVVLWLLALFLAMQTINTIKEFRFIGGGVPVSNVISVSGEGEVFAVPDIATFSFSVIEERLTAGEAQDSAAQKINEVLAFIKGKGVEENDIKTTSFNLYPRYEFHREPCIGFDCPPSSERVLIGFEVNQTVVVKVRDTKDAGEIIAGIAEFGISNISGLTFTIDDKETLEREARSLAIDDARKKARELTRDLGVSLVRVVSFSESGGPVFFESLEFNTRAVSVGGSLDIVPDLPVGENKIVSRVTITYEIR